MPSFIHDCLAYFVGTTGGSIDRVSFWTFITALATVGGFYYVAKQLQYSKQTTIASIRPKIVATRLSKDGEIGIFAGEDGLNRTINVMNVGPGYAHKVNVRVSPPAKAYAIDEGGIRRVEGPIFVFHGLEMPSNTKRMWDDSGGLCTPASNWHYLYAEYEDTEGTQYFSIQSGYTTKTGRIDELQQKIRKTDEDVLWVNKEMELLEHIDASLKAWAVEQKTIFEKRKR